VAINTNIGCLVDGSPERRFSLDAHADLPPVQNVRGQRCGAICSLLVIPKQVRLGVQKCWVGRRIPNAYADHRSVFS
jgi:hypothetical protein